MEINPFHNGHLYFLQEARKIAKDNLLVCIISTNIVQRGEVSVLDKKTKTNLLLANGVDIVCELPAVLANQGGEYFAEHALRILSHFDIGHLIFGSESGDLNLLKQQLTFSDQASFKNGIHSNLKTLKSNDILGLSYLKAGEKLEFDIDYHLIKRISSEYNDSQITSPIASATSIRNNMDDFEQIKQTLPVESLANISPCDQELLFNLFKVNLENAIDNNSQIFLAENNQLLFRMKDKLAKHQPQTLAELLDLCKDKNNSKYKYSRIVINTVLGVTVDKFNPDEYIRLLGFTPRSTKYLPLGAFTSLAGHNSNIAQIEKRAAKLFSILTGNFQYDEFDRKPLIYKEKHGI